MKTDELLEKATPRPWRVSKIDATTLESVNGDWIAAFDKDEDRDLAVCAVNAFEPMREALRKVARGSEWLTDADFDAIRAALALAEGQEP